MYVNTHVDDPSLESEYDRWYRDVHFPDVTEPGIFVKATMFHNTVSPPPPGEGRFLAFYECFWRDLDAASHAFSAHVARLGAQQQIHAGTVGALFGIYRTRALELGTERRRRSQSVVAEHLDCRGAEPEALAEWYAEKRLPAAVARGRFHSASFHELLYDADTFNGLARAGAADAPPGASGLASGQPRFLALYESDLGHPRHLADGLRRLEPAPPAEAAPRGTASFYRAGP